VTAALPGLDPFVEWAAFGPDGKLLAAADLDSSTYLWDAAPVSTAKLKSPVVAN
jgi:hypothetical protein